MVWGAIVWMDPHRIEHLMAKGAGMILSIADALGSRAIRVTRSLGKMGVFLGASLVRLVLLCDYFITSVLL
jgi:hypothetical protein